MSQISPLSSLAVTATIRPAAFFGVGSLHRLVNVVPSTSVTPLCPCAPISCSGSLAIPATASSRSRIRSVQLLAPPQLLRMPVSCKAMMHEPSVNIFCTHRHPSSDAANPFVLRVIIFATGLGAAFELCLLGLRLFCLDARAGLFPAPLVEFPPSPRFRIPSAAPPLLPPSPRSMGIGASPPVVSAAAASPPN